MPEVYTCLGVLWLIHVILAVKFHPLYSLDDNHIKDNGAGMLADALKVNQSLQNLRSVAESFIMNIHTCYIPFMPGSHAMQCFPQS